MNAPDRIWVWKQTDRGVPYVAGGWIDRKGDGQTEYIRADPAVILAAARDLPEVKALIDLLAEARNDLEVYVGAEYPEVSRDRYPSVQRRWLRDMELCHRIDCALADLKTDAKGGA